MGYYIKLTRLSMKYFLILWVCSAVHNSCLAPPIAYTQPFKSHYDCVHAGYLNGMEMVEKMTRTVVEKDRLFVAFNCRLEPTI